MPARPNRAGRFILPLCRQAQKRKMPGGLGGWPPKSTHTKQRGAHYLQVTQAHYDQAVREAVRFPVQHAAAEPCTDLQDESAEAISAGLCETMQNDATPCKNRRLHRLTPRGLEPRLPG